MKRNSVTVLVFKYSVPAILWLILFSFITLAFFFYLLVSSPGYLWLWLPLACFVIYIRNAKKAPFKTRIIDENKLIFSTDGIDYGDDHYPANEIDAIAIYLYAFDNFEYRDGFVSKGQAGVVYAKAPGDKNKLSFRSGGNVFDFNFYIDDFARFCAIRNVINDWSEEGINVYLKQAFDDDFMVQEMEYYQTPAGSNL